ncbi:LLM class flavin-dependent oxidoreductase [Gordonia sp. CPCC 205515]|uniref:LLM class flavin-dependent oxidoreductase n=1 Tax=Gordonia sp. CPCC 205515 TaxID=3140791 RepID=UPI003AF34931
MRYGICILPDQPWRESCPLWQRAEDMGFDHAWTYDHLVWGGLPDSQWFSSIPTLTAAAGVTTTIKLGTFVISPNFRHPAALAREIQTVIDISGDRLLVGLGAGGTPDDLILGQAEVTTRQRVDRFQEFTRLLDRTLSDDRVTVDGEYFSTRNMRLVGGSVRSRVPLLVAGNGPRSVRFAARTGDGWVTTGSGGETVDEWFAGIARSVAVVDEVCAAEGRRVDRFLSLDAGPRNSLASVGLFDDLVGRADELGFTDVVAHWPRETDPYRASMSVLEEVATRLRH